MLFRSLVQMIREHDRELVAAGGSPAAYFFDLFILNQHQLTKDCTSDEEMREQLIEGWHQIGPLYAKCEEYSERVGVAVGDVHEVSLVGEGHGNASLIGTASRVPTDHHRSLDRTRSGRSIPGMKQDRAGIEEIRKESRRIRGQDVVGLDAFDLHFDVGEDRRLDPPGQTPDDFVGAVGKQVNSAMREAPAPSFSRASRWASYEKEIKSNSTPGPGAYD